MLDGSHSDGSPQGSRPLLRWGLVTSVVSALEKNLREIGSAAGVEAVYVGLERPREEARFPAVLVGTGALEIRPEGMAGYQPRQVNAGDLATAFLSLEAQAKLTDAQVRELNSTTVASLPYFMDGTVTFEVLGRSREEAWTVSDLITRMYIGGMLYTNSFFNTTAADVEQIGLGFNSGRISWSEAQDETPPWDQGSQETLSLTTASVEFVSEHYVLFDFLQVSSLVLEAVPVTQLPATPQDAGRTITLS